MMGLTFYRQTDWGLWGRDSGRLVRERQINRRKEERDKRQGKKIVIPDSYT